MKVTNFGTQGLPLPLGSWSTGATAISSNAISLPGGPTAQNFVQLITANGSNSLPRPIVNFAAGTNIGLAVSSNTITISSTGGSGSAMPWFDVEDYGAVHNGATDDTVAVQAAITACMAAGGGTVFFPNGIYAINGALQSTSTYNSQLTIPQNPLTGGLTQPPISIAFVGMGPNAQSNNGAIGDWLPSESGAILLSNWAGAISGSPAVIAAGKVDAQYPAASFNWVQVAFENIEIRCQPNPKLTAIQMRATVMARYTHVTVSTDTASDGMALPSNTNAIGIDQPLAINSNPPDTFDDVFIDGFYTGVRTSEQTNGSITVSHCTRGIQFTGGVGTPTFIRHANQFNKILSVACPRVLVFDTDERWVSIDLLQIEHDSTAHATFGEVYDIDDASNYARGFIRWHVTDYTTGPVDDLLVNGGTGLSLHGMFAKRWKLNNVVHIPTGTDPATNPATGGFLYAASADGHPSWRDTTGAVVDLHPGFVGCRAYNSATQNIANATVTAVTFDTEAFDTSAIHSTSANTSRFTVPAGKTGAWAMVGGFGWDTNAVGTRYAWWKQNGTDVIGSLATIPAGAAVAPAQQVSIVVGCTAGDYFELIAYQDSTGTRALGNAGGDPKFQAAVTFYFLGP